MRIRDFMTLAALLAAASLTTARAQQALDDEAVSLVIDPYTGQSAIRNDSDETIDLNGYLLTSSDNVFDAAGWNSFEDQSVPGFLEGPGAANRLAELNLFESLAIGAGETADLGALYTEISPAEIGVVEPTLQFSYSLANGEVLTGDVEFSRRNNVVLVVNTDSGETSLVNQSEFDIDVDSYLITADNASLDVAGWSPIAESDTAWASAGGAANRLAEGNLLGSSPLASNGGSIALGSPIDLTMLSDETDLRLRFGVAGEGQIEGAVLFVGGVVEPELASDFNGDGAVDLVDLNILGSNFGAPAPVANGDANGDGLSDLVDLNILGSEFGMGVASAVAVPEPSAIVISMISGATILLGRRR